VSINDLNNKFSVTVNGVKGTITLPANNTGTIKDLASSLEAEINKLEDPNTGKPIRGVKVAYDPVNNRLNFTTGNTGDGASIKVTGSADWGLSNTEIARGTTSTWYSMHQFTDTVDGVPKPQFIDENGKQTALRDGFNTLPTWSPIYLDRGELSFDLSGKTLSPVSNMLFDTAFLEGGKGALTMQIDFTQSTQYSSPFAVLSQSQDGAPEGDLMGLDIGVDGLVSANYSNGSQQSLVKIVLANFSSPTGLRQVGDASYLASSTSGKAKIGEGGSAGFGTIRAGATERANVDLTKELVDLITAQRNFQANAKAIETSSTMTQAIVNIRT
jgi:flagellar hook protein FlgE